MAATSCPMRTRTGRVRRRSTSTPCASRRANCGARPRTRATVSISICGRAILSQPEAKACADAALQPIRRAEGEPLFAEPWEAQALALVVALQQAGCFTAVEWADALGAAIKRAQAAGDPDDGSTYYHHVLAALEHLVQEKKIASADLLAARKAAWIEAYEHTPHGKPVELR